MKVERRVSRMGQPEKAERHLEGSDVQSEGKKAKRKKQLYKASLEQRGFASQQEADEPLTYQVEVCVCACVCVYRSVLTVEVMLR